MRCTTLRLFLALSISVTPAMVEADSDLASEVKAAYLYNFARFVQWPEPESNSDDFKLCIIGNPQIVELLASTSRREILGRRLDVIALNNINKTASCQIVFIAKHALKWEKQILDMVRDLPILTVLDTGTSGEGIISLVLVDGRLRFRINQHAAAKVRLHIPAQVLKLAVEVL